MPDRVINYWLTNYSALTLVWVGLLSTLGGVSNYFKKVSAGVVRRFSLAELVGDLTISGFVGFITFLLADNAGFDPRITAAMVGVSGHMGSRIIFMFEKLLTKKFSKFFSE
jgi:hypothetical protein